MKLNLRYFFPAAVAFAITSCKREFKSFQELQLDRNSLTGKWLQTNPYPGASPNVIEIKIQGQQVIGEGYNDNATYEFFGTADNNPFDVKYSSESKLNDGMLEFTFESADETKTIAVVSKDTIRFYWSKDNFIDMVRVRKEQAFLQSRQGRTSGNNPPEKFFSLVP